MAYDEKIINYAKGLYLQVTESNKKVNSFRDISDILLKKFGIRISYATISYWAKKERWENEREILKNDTENKTIVPLDKQTEQIESRFLADLLKDYKNARMLTNIGYDSVFKIYRGENAKLSYYESLQSIKIGTDIQNSIRGLPELTSDKEKTDKPTVWKFGDNYIEF